MPSYTIPYIKHDGLSENTMEGCTLVRYNKPMTDASLGAYRSVVFKGEKLVAFSPPKSVPFSKFREAQSMADCTVREFVDGTMLYLWHNGDKDQDQDQDQDKHQWCVSTRSRVKADKYYRRNVWPLEPVEDAAFGTKKIPNTPFQTFTQLVERMGDPSLFYAQLRKNCTYVFSLLQRNSFNVVQPHQDEMFLIATYELSDGNKVEEVQVDVPGVLRPPLHLFRSYSEMLESMAGKGCDFKGYYLCAEKEGAWSKVLNPSFSAAYEVVGADINFNKTVLKHVQSNQESKLVAINASFQENVDAVKTNLEAIALKLYNNYMTCFIRKRALHKSFPFPYRELMYHLHGQYLTTKKRITLETAHIYLKSMPLNELARLIGIVD